MTAGPLAGPASAYPTFRRPASICFKGPNGRVSPRFDRAHTCLLRFAWLRFGKAVQGQLSGSDRQSCSTKKTPARLVDFFGLLDCIHWSISLVVVRRGPGLIATKMLPRGLREYGRTWSAPFISRRLAQ